MHADRDRSVHRPEVRPGSYIQYTKNPHYWQAGQPKASSLLIRFINNEQAMLAAVESGGRRRRRVASRRAAAAQVAGEPRRRGEADPVLLPRLPQQHQGPIANIDVRKAMNTRSTGQR